MRTSNRLRHYKIQLAGVFILYLLLVWSLPHTEPEISFMKDTRVTIRVPSEYATLNEAILYANEGDIIRISASSAAKSPVTIATKGLQIVCDEGVNLWDPHQSSVVGHFDSSTSNNSTTYSSLLIRSQSSMFIMKVEELPTPYCPDRSQTRYLLDFLTQEPFDEN